MRGVPLAAETVRRIVAATGHGVANQYRREAMVACQPPAAAPMPTAGPIRVDVILDGAWIHSRENARGMEVKVGVAHTGSEPCGATRTRVPTRRDAASAQGIIPLCAAGHGGD